ncbi:tubulin epsilon and delta complex protein 1-like isoform X2 [Antedon mediterranea]|uniref:tubulin epsilon and delta complex protein 1-like isoform X2 n=1 Tax=Antedon mediterranea TaxID=105859 RepID=UPI003AF4C9C5
MAKRNVEFGGGGGGKPHQKVTPLWNLLFDMCVLVSTDQLPNEVHPNTAEVIALVTETMEMYGYHVALNKYTESQDLLLAFSWLLAKEHLAERIVINALKNIPVDIHCLQKFGKKKTDNPIIFSSNIEMSDDKIKQVAWLLGKCKMRMRSLSLHIQEYTALFHKINSYTCDVSISSFSEHLSGLEVFLLRHPQYLHKVQLILERTNCKLESYLKWKENESVFWSWMVSVVNLKLQNNTASDGLQVFTPAIHVPTVHNDSRKGRIQQLRKLNCQLLSSLEQCKLIHLNDMVKALVLDNSRLSIPSKKLTQIQQETDGEINGYQSKSIVHRSVHHQRFLYKQNKTGSSLVESKLLGTSERILGIKDEISRLELKVNERKELINTLMSNHHDELQQLLDGINCICIPPLTKTN